MQPALTQVHEEAKDLMTEENYKFQVGDLVIHWVYGPGTVTQLDEKELDGHVNQYYVLETQDLTVWVPISDAEETCLRLPTPAADFNRLFNLLTSQGEPLSTDRLERKIQLSERMRSGLLEEICKVIRDLSYQRQISKMNDNDNATLERARKLLLSEWSMVLNIPITQANRDLERLLSSLPQAEK